MTRTTNQAAEGVEPPFEAERLLDRDVPLWRHTSMRVGGPARFYAEPTDPDALRSLLQWTRRNACPYAVLGGGSNVVFPDAGYDGLVIGTAGLRGRIAEGTHVRVAAGERLAAVAWWASRLGLSGLEWACGVPGSIGGAVVMNAGTRDGDVAGVLSFVDVLTSEGTRTTMSAESLRLGYRTSAFLAEGLRGTIIQATLALRRGEPAACVDRARGSIAERLRKLPVGASAGCIFRNPATGPTAGELLDRAGCKGLRIGQATVSSRHANVIVNEGSDNASDVLRLIDRMKKRVLDAFGVELREEVVRFDRESAHP